MEPVNENVGRGRQTCALAEAGGTQEYSYIRKVEGRGTSGPKKKRVTDPLRLEWIWDKKLKRGRDDSNESSIQYYMRPCTLTGGRGSRTSESVQKKGYSHLTNRCTKHQAVGLGKSLDSSKGGGTHAESTGITERGEG